MTDHYTENLAEFGFREIDELQLIFETWDDTGLPKGFSKTGVRPAFNKLSGNVFLVNGDNQMAMMRGLFLQLFHVLPHSGKEGFLPELMHENRPYDLHADDVQYIFKVYRKNMFHDGLLVSEGWYAAYRMDAKQHSAKIIE